MKSNISNEELGCFIVIMGAIGLLLYIISIYLCFNTIPSKWLLSIFIVVSLFLIIVSFTKLDDDISSIENNFIEIIKAKITKFFSFEFYLFYLMLVALIISLSGLYAEGNFDEFGDWNESFSIETQLMILGILLIIIPFSYWISLLKVQLTEVKDDYKHLINKVLRGDELSEDNKNFYNRELEKLK